LAVKLAENAATPTSKEATLSWGDVVDDGPHRPRKTNFTFRHVETLQDDEERVLQPHVLAEGPEVPEELHKSVTRIVSKLVSTSWVQLYDGLQEELALRARTVAAWLAASQPLATGREWPDDFEEIYLSLPIFGSQMRQNLRRHELQVPSRNGRIRHDFPGDSAEVGDSRIALLHELHQAYHEFDEFAEMLVEHLQPLEFRIMQEHEAHNELNRTAHTPYVHDLAKLIFRQNVIFNSRLQLPLRAAIITLVLRLHAVCETRGTQVPEYSEYAETIDETLEVFEALAVHDDSLSDRNELLPDQTTFRSNLLAALHKASDLYSF
jgi:hypothetical protein